MPIEESLSPPGIVLSGEIDIDCANELRSVGTRAVESLGAGGALRVDFSDVTFLDSSGVGALIAVRNAANALHASVILGNLSHSVRRLFELSGLIDSFSIDSDAK